MKGELIVYWEGLEACCEGRRKGWKAGVPQPACRACFCSLPSPSSSPILLLVLSHFVAGLLGLGGGMIIGPVLLSLGVHPQVSLCTPWGLEGGGGTLHVPERQKEHRMAPLGQQGESGASLPRRAPPGQFVHS